MFFTVEQTGHDGVDGLVGGTADHGVHLGDFFFDLAAVALGQTAGDDHLQVGICLLVGAGLKDVFDGLGLGALDESAGVESKKIYTGMRKRKTEISASHEKIMEEKFPFFFHMQDKM